MTENTPIIAIVTREQREAITFSGIPNTTTTKQLRVTCPRGWCQLGC